MESVRIADSLRLTTDSGSAPTQIVPGKLLAVDVGLARIGVATCDPLGLTVRPLQVIRRRSRNEDFAVLAAIVEAEEAGAVVCGLPLHMDGSEGRQAATTRKWAGRLAQALRALLGRPVPVIYWDERLSSFAARDLLAASGENTGEETGEETGEDAVAAAVILQNYLDARRAGDSRDYGRVELPVKAE